MWLCWLLYFYLKKSEDKSYFLSQPVCIFPRMENLRTRKTSNGSNFGWLIRQMSINQKSGRETFRRRFVSGSVFVSPCPPECYYKAKRKLSLISGYKWSKSITKVQLQGLQGCVLDQSMKRRSHQTVKKSEIAKKTRNICRIFFEREPRRLLVLVFKGTKVIWGRCSFD